MFCATLFEAVLPQSATSDAEHPQTRGEIMPLPNAHLQGTAVLPTFARFLLDAE
jgi:hypothetical protein